MADKLVANRDDESVIERYVDMGDGTFALLGTSSSDSATNPSTVIVGQAKITVTGNAVQLGAGVITNSVFIKSLMTNNIAKQTVGNSNVTNTTDGTGNGFILFPGESGGFVCKNSNDLWVNGTAGDIFTYQGS